MNPNGTKRAGEIGGIRIGFPSKPVKAIRGEPQYRFTQGEFSCWTWGEIHVGNFPRYDIDRRTRRVRVIFL